MQKARADTRILVSSVDCLSLGKINSKTTQKMWFLDGGVTGMWGRTTRADSWVLPLTYRNRNLGEGSLALVLTEVIQATWVQINVGDPWL